MRTHKQKWCRFTLGVQREAAPGVRNEPMKASLAPPPELSQETVVECRRTREERLDSVKKGAP